MNNEALAKLDGLVGKWDLTITDAWFLDSLDVEVHGKATIEWLGEAFLHLHSTWDDDSTWDWVIGGSVRKGSLAAARRLHGTLRQFRCRRM